MQELERKPHARLGIIDRIEVGDCWQWIGRLDRDGYGRFGKRGRPAHRVVWEALVGPIPVGHHLDHLCRNKACVNPDHLEPVLPVVNVRRTPVTMPSLYKHPLQSDPLDRPDEYEPPLDAGVADFVHVLVDAGVETFESCQGGEGHAYPEPTIRFHGHRSEGLRALAVAIERGLPVHSLRRIWTVIDGEPTGPYWELVFT